MIAGYALAGILAIVLPVSLGCLIAWGIWGRPKGDHHRNGPDVKPVGTLEYWTGNTESMTDDEWLSAITTVEPSAFKFTLNLPVEMKPNHRSRDNPYPDELDQQFCDECETLCILPDRPCNCCWADELDTVDDGNPDWAVKLAWETVQWQAEQAAALATWKQELGITSETT